MAVNDNWDFDSTWMTLAKNAGAFDLTEMGDAALIITLAPGTYTAQVGGVGGTTGIGLIELYELP